MTERKSYGQFCGLARSLDRIGDRWTLLLVRELLLGDRTFRELERALAGISPSLLADRLAQLTDDGLVERNGAPRRSKNVEYRLTDTGRGLEPVVIELIRWGSRWMTSGPDDDLVDARWAPLALRAVLQGQPTRRGRIHLDVNGVAVTVASAGRRQVTAGHHGRADATVAAPLPVVLAVAAGVGTLPRGSVSGDIALATELLRSEVVNDADTLPGWLER